MNNQFYITLPSNTLAGNTASNFRVTLPQRIRLEGDWEVGLAEIIYPNSWYNVSEENNKIELVYTTYNLIEEAKQQREAWPRKKLITLTVPPGRYTDINKLLEMMTALCNTFPLKTHDEIPEAGIVNFALSQMLNKVVLSVKPEFIKGIKLSNQLSSMLGFDKNILYEYRPKVNLVKTVKKDKPFKLVARDKPTFRASQTINSTAPIEVKIAKKEDTPEIEVTYTTDALLDYSKSNKDSGAGVQLKRANVSIPFTRHDNMYKMILLLNQGITKAIALNELQDPIPINFTVNENLKKIEFFLNKKYIKGVRVNRALGKILGFDNLLLYWYDDNEKDSMQEGKDEDEENEESILEDPEIKKVKSITAPHAVDLNSALETFYLYCNIIESQIVGNALIPLLKIIDVQGDFNSIICNHYDNPHYIAVLQKDLSTVEINIKNDMNELVSFEFGKCVVKLHFRRSSPSF